MSHSEPSPDRTLARVGRRAWWFVGIAVAAAILASTIAAVSGLVIPLVVATVIGALLHPVVDRLEQARVPRSVGAALVLVGLLAVVGVAIWMTVVGVIEESDEISSRITNGIEYLDEQIDSRWDAIDQPDQTRDTLADFLGDLIGGLGSWFSTVFSSLAAFAVGSFVGLFFLFYLLRDWHQLHAWVAGHLGVDPTLGGQILDDATSAIRRYFGAITTSSVVTAVVIGAAAAILDVPLAFTIALVTLVTSYVPYLGAIFSGAFAVLIALGSAGTREALILLIVILVVQNIVQTLMLTKLSSDTLELHPIVNLGSTIVGAAVAGLLGATLSAPVVAIIIGITARVREQRAAA